LKRLQLAVVVQDTEMMVLTTVVAVVVARHALLKELQPKERWA
jgi:hypothetical protein